MMLSSKPNNQRSRHLETAKAPSAHSSKITNLSEVSWFGFNGGIVVRESEMQQQLGSLEDELKKARDELAAAEEDKLRLLDELREMKKVASEAMSAHAHENSQVNELERASVESAKKRDQAWQLELEAIHKQHALDVEALSSASHELERVKGELSAALKARDLAINEAAKSRNLAKVNAKESEVKLSEALLSQTKQLEETMIFLEEAKLEIISLHEKVQSLENSVAQRNKDLNVSHQCLEKAKLETHSIKEECESLKTALQVAKEGEADTLSNVRSLTEENKKLRTEVKLATDAEEKSKKAMDDLAQVVIDFSKENKELKESLRVTKSELDSAREDAESSKKRVKPTEEKFQSLLEEARKEIDQVRSAADRLKLEAEDSILAWNQKEQEFVSCIRRADEESNAAKYENSKLRASLIKAEEMAKIAREENCKLRDILKQALNETSAAKEAAEIAREDNSQLKDNLLDKEDVLQELARENERLRIKETAGHETIKELKRLLSSKSVRESRALDMDKERIFQTQQLVMKEHEDNRNIKEIWNFKFEEPQAPNQRKTEDEDPEMAEMLKGSIFDVMDSPVYQKSVSHHRKSPSLTFTGDGEGLDIDNLDGIHLEDTEDKNSLRKKKALLRRFGELIRRTSFHRRETSIGLTWQVSLWSSHSSSSKVLPYHANVCLHIWYEREVIMS